MTPHNIPQQQGNTPPSAALSFDGKWPSGLHGTPRADGDRVVLGHFDRSRVDVTIASQSAEWYDDLIAALTTARDRLCRLAAS